MKFTPLSSSLFAGTALALSLSACQSPATYRTGALAPASTLRAQQAAPAPRVNLQQNTRLFEQPIPVAVTADTLIFEDLSVSLEVNQVVMGRSLQGEDFLRRVVSLRTQGRQTIVTTRPASLFDAFKELQANEVSLSRSPERVSVRSQRFNIGGVMDIVVDLGVRPDFSEAQIQLKDSRLKVNLAPRFEVDTQIRSELTFIKPVQNDLSPVGQVTFTAARFPAWIGPVPVVFQIKPGAALSWGHQASGSLVQSLNIDGFIQPQLTMEAALKQTPQTSGTIQHQIQAQLAPPALSIKGKAHARLYVPQIQFESELAGIVGPFISAGTYIDATYQREIRTQQGQNTVNTFVNADLGLSVYGGITPTQLFGSDLTREIRVKILEKNLKNLYNKQTSEPLQP
jgi:hypothetical protein